MKTLLLALAVMMAAACVSPSQMGNRNIQAQFAQAVNMPAQAGPGWSVNDYFHQKSVADRSATTCGGPFAQGLQFHYLNLVDPRANRVVAYKDGTGMLDTSGCFFQPAIGVLADLDGDGRFDLTDLDGDGRPDNVSYYAAGVHGTLTVPMQAGETVLLYFLQCDAANVCRTVGSKRYPYGGDRSYMDATGGFWISH